MDQEQLLKRIDKAKRENSKFLNLSRQGLTSLPAEIGNLLKLKALYLSSNLLMSLPLEITNLKKLETPPPEIVQKGPKAVLAYLRAEGDDGTEQWTSKLLIVGEGGVGKTSLLKRLNGQNFDDKEETTHGINIVPVDLPHPEQKDVYMTLKSWDFGGQQIYHATHQFFLTNRSLFLVLWNARLEYKQGNIDKWLNVIQSLAPDSPVLLVATHIDERKAELPIRELKEKYPQIRDYYEVSNKTGDGVAKLEKTVAEEAAGLPLMGERWPEAWLNAAQEVRIQKDNFCTYDRYLNILEKNNVTGKNAEVLTGWLHDLGDILYFEDDELKDTVFLDPQWVSEMIYRVLDVPEVIDKLGIFTREKMDEVWKDVADPKMRQRLLRLMERFDLSYRTKDNQAISYVVERLSMNPAKYETNWYGIKKKGDYREIVMKFDFHPKPIPAGIPTWFIPALTGSPSANTGGRGRCSPTARTKLIWRWSVPSSRSAT